jgi:hypothetical protein
LWGSFFLLFFLHITIHFSTVISIQFTPPRCILQARITIIFSHRPSTITEETPSPPCEAQHLNPITTTTKRENKEHRYRNIRHTLHTKRTL